jgi:hypothetical protein
MKLLPRLLPLCLLAFLSPGVSSADSLSAQHKATLVNLLQQILAGNESTENKVVTAALSALRPGASDENAALDLYEKSCKKVLFDDKNKKDKDWRAWKDQNKDKLSNSAFKKSLKIRCQWAILCLQAASIKGENPDYSKLTTTALSIVSAISNDYANLKEQKGELGSNLLSGPVGTFLGVGQIRGKDFPDSPTNIGDIFEKLVFPPYRNTNNVTGLREAWNKRIKLTMDMSDTKGDDDSSSNNSDQTKKKTTIRGYVSSSQRNSGNKREDLTDEANKTMDSLLWACEMDCFKHGDEATASKNMLSLIRKTKDPREQSARVQELMRLMVGDAPVPSLPMDDSTSDGFGSTQKPKSVLVAKPQKPSKAKAPVDDDDDIEIIDDAPAKPAKANKSSKPSKNAKGNKKDKNASSSNTEESAPSVPSKITEVPAEPSPSQAQPKASSEDDDDLFNE